MIEKSLLGSMAFLGTETRMVNMAKNLRLKRKLIRTDSHSMVAELWKVIRE